MSTPFHGADGADALQLQGIGQQWTEGARFLRVSESADALGNPERFPDQERRKKRPGTRSAWISFPPEWWSESPEKSVKILVFPASRSVITVKLAFAPVKFTSVNLSASVFVNLLWNNGVEHFVVDDIFEEPGRDKRSIK